MSSYLTLPSGKPNPYKAGGGSQPAPKAAPVNPWGSAGDPTQRQTGGNKGTLAQAQSGLRYAAQKGWGRDLTGDEEQSIYAHAKTAGYKDDGVVDDNIYNSSLDYMAKVMGGQPVQQAGPDPMKPGSNSGLGVDNAMNQWKQQAPAVGVPQSFRGTNPYAEQQQSMMQKILAGPETMGQQQQDQINESQKESAARMMAQVQNQAGQTQANRGFSSGGGQERAMQGQAQQDMMSQLLAGRRDTALKAAQTNRQDQYNALNAASGLHQDEFNGQMDLSKLGLDQMNTNRQGNLQDFLGMHGADMETMGLNQRDNQFKSQHGLDFLRYLAQKEQFGSTLDENKRQHNNQQGFNWASLNAQQQQQLMSQVFGFNR